MQVDKVYYTTDHVLGQIWPFKLGYEVAMAESAASHSVNSRGMGLRRSGSKFDCFSNICLIRILYTLLIAARCSMGYRLDLKMKAKIVSLHERQSPVDKERNFNYQLKKSSPSQDLNLGHFTDLRFTICAISPLKVPCYLRDRA